jgi:hypothetical protein
MPPHIEERVACSVPRNAAIADISTEAHLVTDASPPSPPSALRRHQSVSDRAGPLQSSPAAQSLQSTRQANDVPAGAAHVDPRRPSPSEADRDAAMIASLRRGPHWPSWLRWPKLSGLGRARTRRQWLVAAAIAAVAMLIGWSIGAKPWSQWGRPKAATVSVPVKGHAAKPTLATIRGQGATKPSSALGTTPANATSRAHKNGPAALKRSVPAKPTGATPGKASPKGTSRPVAQKQSKRTSQVRDGIGQGK